MRRRWLFWVLPLAGLAQEPTVYQLSGMILSATTGEPVPYVSIRVGRTRRGTVANADGFYSLPVVRGDTLYFSALGYKRARFSVSEYLNAYSGDTSQGFIYAVHYLVEDTIELPTVRIQSIRTPEELKTALLNIPLETQTQTARDNVSPELIAYFIQNLPADPQERIKIAQQRYRDLYYERTLRPVYPILDPIAAYRLVRYLAEKAQIKREKIYDYWRDD